MGNDAHLICLDCKIDKGLMRAHFFREELMNKPFDVEILRQARSILLRADLSLNKILTQGWSTESFLDEMNDFIEQHPEHDIWLVDDYSEKREKHSDDGGKKE